MSYTPGAILGPIKFPRLSNGQVRRSCRGGRLKLYKCTAKTHGWICSARLRWIIYSVVVVKISHSKVSCRNTFGEWTNIYKQEVQI